MKFLSPALTFCARRWRRQSVVSFNTVSPQASSSSTTGFQPKSLDEINELLNEKVGDECEKQRILEMEAEYRRYLGDSMPAHVTPEMWQKLAGAHSESERRVLWENFAVLDALRRSNHEERKRHRQYAHKCRTERVTKVLRLDGKSFEGKLRNDEGRSVAGPILGRLFSRVDAKRVKETHLLRYNFALQFGQPLVFDFDLPHNMSSKDIKQAVTQLKHIYKYNIAQWEPFNLYLCNFDRFGHFLNVETSHDFRLNKTVAAGSSSQAKMWNETNRSFLDLFPKQRVVYLSPESKHPLTSFSHDDIYVIGALNDQRKRDVCLGLPKAKALGLRTAKLDVDEYFYRLKRANMSLLHVFRALIDAKDTDGNWGYSLRRLPRTHRVRWKARYRDGFGAQEEQVDGENLAENLDGIFDNHRALVKELFLLGGRSKTLHSLNESREEEGEEK